jgi:hypothetical protein
MKKLIYYLAVPLMVFLTVSSCKKQSETEEKLPTGENTLYCYIDNKLYIPEPGNSIPPVPAIYYSGCSDNSSFSIVGRDITLFFYNGITHTGSIVLNQSHYDICQVFDNHAYYTKKENVNGVLLSKLYYTHNGSGTVNITYLSDDKRKFKGTFKMTVYHEDTNAEIHITGGHFNINLDTLND